MKTLLAICALLLCSGCVFRTKTEHVIQSKPNTAGWLIDDIDIETESIALPDKNGKLVPGKGRLPKGTIIGTPSDEAYEEFKRRSGVK